MLESPIKVLKSINVTRVQGGFREFERTGIYPDHLVFKSSLLKKTWKQRVKSEKQNGVIKSKGNTLFNYELTPNRFRLKYIDPDGEQSLWVNKDLMLVIYD
jgi:hypothetical protein